MNVVCGIPSVLGRTNDDEWYKRMSLGRDVPRTDDDIELPVSKGIFNVRPQSPRNKILFNHLYGSRQRTFGGMIQQDGSDHQLYEVGKHNGTKSQETASNINQTQEIEIWEQPALEAATEDIPVSSSRQEFPGLANWVDQLDESSEKANICSEEDILSAVEPLYTMEVNEVGKNSKKNKSKKKNKKKKGNTQNEIHGLSDQFTTNNPLAQRPARMDLGLLSRNIELSRDLKHKELLNERLDSYLKIAKREIDRMTLRLDDSALVVMKLSSEVLILQGRVHDAEAIAESNKEENTLLKKEYDILYQSTIEKKDPKKFDEDCQICLDAKRCVVIMPCRHMPTCEGCTKGLVTCPVCRSNIDNTIRIYL